MINIFKNYFFYFFWIKINSLNFFFYYLIFKRKFSQFKINILNNFLLFQYQKKLYYKKKNIYFFLSHSFLDYKKKIYQFILNFRFFFKKIFLKKKYFNKSLNKAIVYKNKNINFFLHKHNLSITNILIKTKLIFNFSDIEFLLKKKFLFLNKNPILRKSNINLFFKKNNYIELVFLKFYFFFLFKLNSFINIYKIFKTKKKKKNKFLKKLKNDFHIKNFILLNIEIDYISLSIILIKDKIIFFNYLYKIKRILTIYNIFYKKWKLYS